jgi:hypothetical protein
VGHIKIVNKVCFFKEMLGSAWKWDTIRRDRQPPKVSTRERNAIRLAMEFNPVVFFLVDFTS